MTATVPFTHTLQYDESTPVLILVKAPSGRLKEIAGRHGTVNDLHEGIDTTLARAGDIHRALDKAGRGPETPSLTFDPKTSVAAHTALQQALEQAAQDAAPDGFEPADVTFIGTTGVTSDFMSADEPHVRVTWKGHATVTWTRVTDVATRHQT